MPATTHDDVRRPLLPTTNAAPDDTRQATTATAAKSVNLSIMVQGLKRTQQQDGVKVRQRAGRGCQATSPGWMPSRTKLRTVQLHFLSAKSPPVAGFPLPLRPSFALLGTCERRHWVAWNPVVLKASWGVKGVLRQWGAPVRQVQVEPREAVILSKGRQVLCFVTAAVFCRPLDPAMRLSTYASEDCPRTFLPRFPRAPNARVDL